MLHISETRGFRSAIRAARDAEMRGTCGHRFAGEIPRRRESRLRFIHMLKRVIDVAVANDNRKRFRDARVTTKICKYEFTRLVIVALDYSLISRSCLQSAYCFDGERNCMKFYDAVVSVIIFYRYCQLLRFFASPSSPGCMYIK